MQGIIQIEVLKKNAVMVAAHLQDASGYEKKILVMALANSLDLTESDLLLIPALYSDFLAKSKCTTRIYRTIVPSLTNSYRLYPAIEMSYWTTAPQSDKMNTSMEEYHHE